MQEARRRYGYKPPIEWWTEHCSADGKKDYQRPDCVMQGTHAPQTEPVAPEKYPQADSQRKRNDVVDDDELGKSHPCGEVDDEHRNDEQKAGFAYQSQPEIGFFLPVKPEERQSHQ